MNLTGKLLVATPLIAAPPFGRSVVIVLAHGEGGAFGLVLNQPTQFQAGDVISEWSDHLAPPAVVFEGGPVERESIVALGYSLDLDEENPSVLAGCVAPVNLGNISQQARELWTGIRIFAGSAGWAPGQLEDEIIENAWWVVDLDPFDVFSSEPESLWVRVLRRQPGELAWFANYPTNSIAN